MELWRAHDLVVQLVYVKAVPKVVHWVLQMDMPSVSMKVSPMVRQKGEKKAD